MSEPLPFPRVAAAILLGALGPLGLACLVLTGMRSPTNLAAWGTAVDFALLAAGSVLLVGLPLAATLLRDPSARVWRWMAVGAGSAWLSAILYGMFMLGPLFLFLLLPISFPGMMVCMMMVAIMAFGAVTGLIARTLLPFLDRI